MGSSTLVVTEDNCLIITIKGKESELMMNYLVDFLLTYKTKYHQGSVSYPDGFI